MKPLVLIIDDDLAFSDVLRDELLGTDFYAFISGAGDAMAPALQRLKPDILLISADLADGSAFSQVSQLRQDTLARSLSIIMYSSSTQLVDKARGLDAGADDFVSKPFSVEEIVARIRGLLRHGSNAGREDVVEAGKLRIDMRGYSVAYEGRSIELSRTLFDVLCFLVRQPDMVFTREQIRDAIWGSDSCISGRSVDVYVTRLRLHLGNDARDMIKTVRRIGYKFSANACAQTPGSHDGVFRRRSDSEPLNPAVDKMALPF